MGSSDVELSPEGFLQLAGHPLRWRLLGGLARSDRTVRELTGLVDEPQNLVSYHLGKLRDARLVSSRRSSADGRDAYYRVDLARVGALLADTGAALHPGLRPPPPRRTSDAVAPTRVLFLCTGNSARSQIAEALAEVRSGGQVEACSAGSHPKPLHPSAVRVLQEEFGIDISDRSSKHLDQFADAHFDQVVTLCDRVREICPELPGRPRPAHWSMPDPSAAAADDTAAYPAFQQTAAEIDERIGFLLATLTPSASPSPTRPLEER